jgi:hypothetical protein
MVGQGFTAINEVMMKPSMQIPADRLFIIEFVIAQLKSDRYAFVNQIKRSISRSMNQRLV